ncbi:MAG: S41 family peptidase [Myxococcota bacterium]
MEIEPNRVRFFDTTRVSCVPVGELPLSDVEASHDRIRGDEDSFSWYTLGHFTQYRFDRLDALPEPCGEQPSDPAATFEALWHLFEENYAFFELRDVDWSERYQTFRNRVSSQSDDEALYGVLQEMLMPFDDGHVYVVDFPGERGFLTGSLGDLWEAWASQYTGEPIESPLNPRSRFIEDMREHVLRDILKGAGNSGFRDLLQWGWLAPGIGYLNVLEMGSGREVTIPEMQVLVDETMYEVMSDLADAEQIVVDVRFNQGGMDTLGYAIAGWFTQERTLVSRKRAVFDGGWTDSEDIYVVPRGEPFLGPVALLIGKNSISAAETFAIAMNELPNVTSVGSRTYGALSDSLVRTLPNGWLVSLSNEVYESPAGEAYERAGVPPDVVTLDDPDAGFYENLAKALLAAMRLDARARGTHGQEEQR